MNVRILAPAVAIGIALVGLALFLSEDSQPHAVSVPVSSSSSSSSTTIPETKISKLQVMETDGIKHLIPLEKIKGGGPPKDGIPSIDHPVFADAQDSEYMSDSDIVIGLEIDGEAKAYPLFILVWHEIVNDRVGKTPVSVTYCPLCYTSQVFERVVDGQEVEFGTSGKLYNSNLLMYDRLTDSYWSQALGLAVKGKLTGHQLNLVPFDVISWGDWKALHPDTLVLTTDTGHIRSYATDPYGDYYTEPRIMFPVEHNDNRLHPKEIIIGFHLDSVHKAYRQIDIESFGLINDSVGEIPVLLVSFFSENSRAFERTVDGHTLEFEIKGEKIVDTATGSVWSYDGMSVSGELEGNQLKRLPIEPGFWFEWVAFHPETQVFGDVN